MNNSNNNVNKSLIINNVFKNKYLLRCIFSLISLINDIEYKYNSSSTHLIKYDEWNCVYDLVTHGHIGVLVDKIKLGKKDDLIFKEYKSIVEHGQSDQYSIDKVTKIICRKVIDSQSFNTIYTTFQNYFTSPKLIKTACQAGNLDICKILLNQTHPIKLSTNGAYLGAIKGGHLNILEFLYHMNYSIYDDTNNNNNSDKNNNNNNYSLQILQHSMTHLGNRTIRDWVVQHDNSIKSLFLNQGVSTTTTNISNELESGLFCIGDCDAIRNLKLTWINPQVVAETIRHGGSQRLKLVDCLLEIQRSRFDLHNLENQQQNQPNTFNNNQNNIKNNNNSYDYLKLKLIYQNYLNQHNNNNNQNNNNLEIIDMLISNHLIITKKMAQDTIIVGFKLIYELLYPLESLNYSNNNNNNNTVNYKIKPSSPSSFSTSNDIIDHFIEHIFGEEGVDYTLLKCLARYLTFEQFRRLIFGIDPEYFQTKQFKKSVLFDTIRVASQRSDGDGVDGTKIVGYLVQQFLLDIVGTRSNQTIFLYDGDIGSSLTATLYVLLDNISKLVSSNTGHLYINYNYNNNNNQNNNNNIETYFEIPTKILERIINNPNLTLEYLEKFTMDYFKHQIQGRNERSGGSEGRLIRTPVSRLHILFEGYIPSHLVTRNLLEIIDLCGEIPDRANPPILLTHLAAYAVENHNQDIIDYFLQNSGGTFHMCSTISNSWKRLNYLCSQFQFNAVVCDHEDIEMIGRKGSIEIFQLMLPYRMDSWWNIDRELILKSAEFYKRHKLIDFISKSENDVYNHQQLEYEHQQQQQQHIQEEEEEEEEEENQDQPKKRKWYEITKDKTM
ncbi:hypothetical protein DFA_11162 [Cavenderia fasciculata]|uniref:Ankyrin repeat-containing protein n=1 Tax=Cavenderia fasciculata TaxID=261658 RepID=F4QF94_CACFS|nr:uncharacterized protein DFA_11162 [Cavenderia fasciculata]EGG13401.1 hypothetical protein DFA_11162 [Cavenderia fasciculata]|eukprot:XP_004350105.1 hypothetical protein DFA_11162 [Cavenderia fasciculata]